MSYTPPLYSLYVTQSQPSGECDLRTTDIGGERDLDFKWGGSDGKLLLSIR